MSRKFRSKMRPFKDARKFARSLKLKGAKEWYAYCTSGKKPEDIPTNPHQSYKNIGWISYSDFLATKRIANQNRKILGLKEAKVRARKIAKKLGIKTEIQWKEAYEAGKIPDDLPQSPYQVYVSNPKRKKK